MARAKKVKAGSRRTRLRSRRRDARGFQGEGSPPVVWDVAQTQQSTSSHLGADVPAGRQMAPESPHSPFLPCGTPVRHYPRHESSALAAHAGICTGVPGNRHSCRDQPLLIYHARLQAAADV